MTRRREEPQENDEYLPLFEGPTDRELFHSLVRLGILAEEEERKDWFAHVKRGEDGVKILNFEEFITSNRDWYLWLLSLHHDRLSPEGIKQKSAERARKNIQRLRKHLHHKDSLS